MNLIKMLIAFVRGMYRGLSDPTPDAIEILLDEVEKARRGE